MGQIPGCHGHGQCLNPPPPLVKASFFILAIVADGRPEDGTCGLLSRVSGKVNQSSNVAWEPYRAGERRWTFIGIILRHLWELSETSIWGPELYTKCPIMLGNDPTWSVECGRPGVGTCGFFGQFVVLCVREG